MGLFSLIGKAAAGTAAAAATTVGGVATAVGGVATAVGGVATVVGGVVSAVGSVATTVGAKVVASSAKIVAGDEVVKAGDTYISQHTEVKVDEVEDISGAKDFEQDFADDNEKAAQDLQKLLENNEKLRFGMFALALFVARLDGEEDTELNYIEECLGNEELIREEIKKELQIIINRKYNFYDIKVRYLDDVSAEEMLYVDKFIKGVMDADGTVSEKERQFYETTWQPYLQSLTEVEEDQV